MKSKSTPKHFAVILLFALALLPSMWHGVQAQPAAHTPAGDGAYEIYLPYMASHDLWQSPFGVESNRTLTAGSPHLAHVDALGGASWIRLGAERISWRELQPTEGGPIQWDLLASFESELRALKTINAIPEIVITDSPRWATIEPTSCGAIRSDKFAAFADFMRQLVERYSTEEFNVHHWELGNEPDVDPHLVAIDNGYGCWGDMDDPYYGGEQYGEMLKVVTPVIRAADPTAKVWLGGLLLDSPNSEETNPGRGRPELFLQGILEAGAAPYFDILAYHLYPPYLNVMYDHDNDLGGRWDSLGGGVLGKARFLRGIMQQYGADKPLFLNETSLMCPDIIGGYPVEWCSPPSASFFDMQADHVVRAFVRGVSEDIMGFMWYTLDGPGWRNTGMFNSDQTPRPVYFAFQTLTQQLAGTTYAAPADYGTEIEGYEFAQATRLVQVVWAKHDTTHTILIPESIFEAAYDQNGTAISPTLVGSNYELTIQFTPIFIHLSGEIPPIR